MFGDLPTTVSLKITGQQDTGHGIDRLRYVENVITGSGDDQIEGSYVDNRLEGGVGHDLIKAHGGDDFLVGGLGDDVLIGGGGVDTVVYGDGGVSVDLRTRNRQDTGEGSDKLFTIENIESGSGNDLLIGSWRQNEISSGAGDDELRGFSGSDRLIGGMGDDLIDGGSGIDTVVYTEQATVNLRTKNWQDTGEGRDRLISIENVETGEFNDRVDGSWRDNVIDTGAGDDYIVGYSGDDLLIGGLGNDVLNGSDGIDTAVFGDIGVSVDLRIKFQQDTGEGLDRLLAVENLESGAGHDVLTGSWGDNYLSSGSGHDVVNGLGGHDQIHAGAGHDVVRAGSGNDVIVGGSGNDELWGHGGADVFRFYRGEGVSTDTIKDFGAGDSIELFDDTGGATVAAQITDGANGSTVTWDELTIVFEGAYINYDDINPISS